MTSLITEIAKKNPQWSLEEFVEIVNQLLPQYLATDKSDNRVREEINPRLVRHYTSQGMLDEPRREGRYAFYTYRHLLQLLVVRRLLSEGLSASSINQLATQKSNLELEHLLRGGLEVQITSLNPALAYLEELKYGRRVTTSSPPPETTIPASQWLRLEIMPGLEIQIRSDFKFPSTLHEEDWLKEKIWQALKTFISQRKRKS
jgi:DNA-binding transcriptional MerR regulator